MNSLFYIIYEFFVKYIFGGTLGVDVYADIPIWTHGQIYDDTESSLDYFAISLDKIGITAYSIDSDEIINGGYITFGNYLSLIATIITLVIICIFLGLFVRWVFKQFTSILRF